MTPDKEPDLEKIVDRYVCCIEDVRYSDIEDVARHAYIQGLREAERVLHDKADNTPVCHEDEQRGPSTYNWLKYAERLVHDRIAELEAK